MRVRISHLKDRKQRRERFAVLTAYDATIAGLLERAGIDVLLVGDSVATAVLGYDTTLPVTLEVMIHHTAAVVRGTEKALVIADMPFLTYQITPSEAVRNAGRLLKDAGAAAVKIEGGQSVIEVVRRLGLRRSGARELGRARPSRQGSAVRKKIRRPCRHHRQCRARVHRRRSRHVHRSCSKRLKPFRRYARGWTRSLPRRS